MVVGNLTGVLKAFVNGQIFGQTFGDGVPRVLLLHGWGRSSNDFVAVGEFLAKQGVASLAVDLPGFGASPLPDVAGGARYYADLLAPLLDEVFSAKPFIVVGHSFGGRVATVLASRATDGIGGLVLTGVPLLRRRQNGRSPWRYRLIRWLAARHLLSDARLESARQRYGSADYRAASGLLRDILVLTVNESYEEELRNVHVPVQLCWGAEDTAVPVKVALRAGEEFLLAPWNLTILPETGHLVPTQRPEALALATLEALDEALA